MDDAKFEELNESAAELASDAYVRALGGSPSETDADMMRWTVCALVHGVFLQALMTEQLIEEVRKLTAKGVDEG